MRLEIRCSHPGSKRKNYGPGWICETERGGCGATGDGETGHWDTVIGYVETKEVQDREKALEAVLEKIRMYVGDGQWIPCGRDVAAAEAIVQMCDEVLKKVNE